uniref:NIDO domain-containing protein n=1 Tax=Biomphalaria glabrata TaxID=6526 RepID=A0A2C9L571_BIOGL
METLATLGRNFSNFSPTFTPKYALIVTWYDVGTEHYGYENDFKKNTFQLVITTDGFQSLVIFNIDTIGWSYFEDLTNYAFYKDIDGIYAEGIAMSTKAGFFKGDGATCYLHEASNTNKMFYLGDVDPNKLIYRVDEVPVTLTFTTASPSVATTVPASASTTPESTSATSTTPESTSASITTPELTSASITTTESTSTTSTNRDTNEERIGLIVGLCLAALVIFLVIVVVSCLLCSKKYEACMCTLQCCVQRASPTMDTSEVTSKLVTTPTAPASGPNGPEPVYNNPILPIVLIPMPNAPCPMPNPTLPPEPVMYFTTLPPIEMTER